MSPGCLSQMRRQDYLSSAAEETLKNFLSFREKHSHGKKGSQTKIRPTKESGCGGSITSTLVDPNFWGKTRPCFKVLGEYKQTQAKHEHSPDRRLPEPSAAGGCQAASGLKLWVWFNGQLMARWPSHHTGVFKDRQYRWVGEPKHILSQVCMSRELTLYQFWFWEEEKEEFFEN